MESQPQNPEFRNNPENFHPCVCFIEFTLSKSLRKFFERSAYLPCVQTASSRQGIC